MKTDNGPPHIVYDDEYVSSLPEFVPGCRNPWRVAVCRSDSSSMRALRKQIETWYGELEPAIRTQFYERLRGEAAETAVAELYVRHWLHSRFRPTRVDYEPLVGRGAPDLVVELSDGTPLVCEVYCPNDVAKLPGRQNVEDEFAKQCHKSLPKGYRLFLDLPRNPATNGEATQLVRSMCNELEVRLPSPGAKCPVRFGSVEGHMKVISAGRAGRTTVDSGALVRPMGPTYKRIQKELREKAAKFRLGLNSALVLMVVDLTGWALDDQSWLNICYGELPFRVTPDSGSPEGLSAVPLPRQGGLFTRHEKGRPRSTYISAVVAGRCAPGPDGLEITFVGFANPFAARPVPCTFLDAIPFWVPDPVRPGSLVRRP